MFSKSMQEVLDILEDIRRGRTVERKQALANQAQPRTAAGRRLLAGPNMRRALLSDILAIEAEAEAATEAPYRLIAMRAAASAPTPAESLDVERMREAHRIAYRDGTDVVVEYNRLAAARTDTSAEQPEGLDVERLAVCLFRHRLDSRSADYACICGEWQWRGPYGMGSEAFAGHFAAEYARLAASPSPEPEAER